VIGLDTNVLARYITQDDPRQTPKANRLLESLTPDEPGFISVVALVELGWVLSSCYNFDRQQLAHTIDLLLSTRALVVENAEVVARALRMFKQGTADFSDCLLERACHAAACSRTLSFDLGAIECAGMEMVR
jgi:predicted nucleic-acid-binding protein